MAMRRTHTNITTDEVCEILTNLEFIMKKVILLN